MSSSSYATNKAGTDELSLKGALFGVVTLLLGILVAVLGVFALLMWLDARDAHRRIARVERRDPVDPAAPGDRGLPGRRRVVADRRHRSQTRHDDSSHRLLTLIDDA